VQGWHVSEECDNVAPDLEGVVGPVTVAEKPVTVVTKRVRITLISLGDDSEVPLVPQGCAFESQEQGTLHVFARTLTKMRNVV
jgi:hypothetical protein